MSTLLKKLGYRDEGLFRDRWNVYGEWRDSVMFGLLKSDWRGVTGNYAISNNKSKSK